MKSTVSFLILLSLLLTSCEEKSSTLVQTKGRKIFLNNSPYLIKGICYHPVPKGETKRSFSTLTQDLQLMQEAGINTIRVYEPIDDLAVLDQIHAAGIKLIMGFGYNQKGQFDIASGSIIEYIKIYKKHPSILFWELGNEYNFHPEWFEGDIAKWYSALNNTAQKIKDIDQNHPVATAHGEIPTAEVLKSNPNIDVWGVNVYRWDQPGSLITEWEERSELPLYFSEAGADSFMAAPKDDYLAGENQPAQADATRVILDQIFEQPDIVNGVALFSFTDGWWKAGNPAQQDQGGWAPFSSGVPYDGAPNEEYWGIVDIDRNKKEAFFVLQKKYTEL
ncbi:MAG: glycoside hydrolase family 2 TIM barrel-domain containing protein [Candidatus Arcticimaribacter sp.]